MTKEEKINKIKYIIEQTKFQLKGTFKIEESEGNFKDATIEDLVNNISDEEVNLVYERFKNK